MMLAGVARGSTETGFSPAIMVRINSDAKRLGMVQTAQQADVKKTENPFENLIQQARTGTTLQQGLALRSLDMLTGGTQITDALLRGELKPDKFLLKLEAVEKENKKAVYPESSLYGSNGPVAADIQQDSFGDCYFVATLAAVAQENPDLIKNAISYDAATQSYNVRLFDENGNAVTVNVTQAEIADNVNRNGGSTMDNSGKSSPSWPAIMETAYAKMHDTNPANGLDEGYNAVVNGGYPDDAMRAVTGNAGTQVRFDKSFFEDQDHALDEMGSAVEQALDNGQPVTAWSVTEDDDRSLWNKLTGQGDVTQDGLADNHVYSVESITKDKNGEWQVTLRNPWATNNGVNEGRDTASASITIPLSELVETGGLNSFQIGQ